MYIYIYIYVYVYTLHIYIYIHTHYTHYIVTHRGFWVGPSGSEPAQGCRIDAAPVQYYYYYYCYYYY